MTHTFRSIALAALLAAPVALSAQTSKPVSFGVSGGLSVPTGELGDFAESGFVVAGHVFLKPASFKSVRFRGDVSFDKWNVKDGDFAGLDVEARSLGFVANAIYDFPTANTSSVRPYILGGIGMFNSKASVSAGSVSASESTTDFGLQAGGGLEFKLSGFSTFLEAKFVNVFTEDSSTTFIPISFGIRF
jgi:Outer membrane protein beta-barrel domain